MSPVEFYLLALRLLANERCPAGFRSATSRAYYAAFLEGIEFLRRMGVQVPRSAASHEHVVFMLMESGDSALDDTGRMLGDLRGYRNGADYRLHQPVHGTEAHATVRVREAGEVMTALTTCRGDRPRFEAAAERIRVFAETILKIQVVGMPS